MQPEERPTEHQKASCSAALPQAAIQNGDFDKSSSQSENNESDSTNGNLTWLFNYKIEELPPVPDTLFENFSPPRSVSSIQTKQVSRHSKVLRNETGMEACPEGPIKPPFTYTQLIESAINEKGELTVSGIYHWITEHFPYYKPTDDRWKNSVRHNLSTNPRFRKGDKSLRGAGHLWTIAQTNDFKTKQTRDKLHEFFKGRPIEKSFEQDALKMELEAAEACLLGEPFDGFGPGLETELEAATPNYMRETFNDFELRDNIKEEQFEIVRVLGKQNEHEDLLCSPVSEQHIPEESDLNNDFLITDLNPTTLGIHFSEEDVINENCLYIDV